MSIKEWYRLYMRLTKEQAKGSTGLAKIMYKGRSKKCMNNGYQRNA